MRFAKVSRYIPPPASQARALRAGLIPLQRGNLTEGFPLLGGQGGGCYSSKLELLPEGSHHNLRPLQNAPFCPISVIARSEATWQSCGLSTCFEIAFSRRSQPTPPKWLRRPDRLLWRSLLASLAMTMLGFFKGLNL